MNRSGKFLIRSYGIPDNPGALLLGNIAKSVFNLLYAIGVANAALAMVDILDFRR